MWTSGQANTIVELANAINSAFTTVGWVKYSTNSKRAIYQGVGSGTDKIYIVMGYKSDGADRLYWDSCAGYDPSLGFFEQPGSILQQLGAEDCTDDSKFGNLPATIITPNERFFYWIYCDTYRIIIITRHSTVYESTYVGFLNPIASERQYPYPMYVCGNSHFGADPWPDCGNGSFVFPQNKAGWLRQIDGVWRDFDAAKQDPSPSSKGTVFPYTAHNRKLMPNYKEQDAINQDNFLLIPIILETNNPVAMVGFLRGCFWISGARDIDSERILVYDGVQYMVYDTKDSRQENTYFAVRMS